VNCDYLAPLTRTELDILMADAEHANRKAQVAFMNAPLRPEAVQAAAGVAQDCMNLVVDCYDMSMLMMAAEMDRMLDA
jgi:hypothetical protein